MLPILRICFCAAAASLLIASYASAQDRDDEQQRGYRFNSFRVQPSIAGGYEYDSNIFRENVNRNNAFTVEISPRVEVVSDWNRHGIRLTLDSEYGIRADNSDDNYFDYSAELAGILDITRRMRVLSSFGYRRGHEDRGTDDVAATLLAVGPSEFGTVFLNVLGEAAFGRFVVSPFFNGRQRDFDDVALVGGGIVNNDDRDRREIEAGVELSYEVRNGFSAFVRPSYLNTNYSDAVDDGGNNRDSDGFRVLAGMKVDLTRLVEASVGVGYQAFDYESPLLSDFSGFAVDAQGIWSITPRLQLIFSASRSVVETTVGGASSAVRLGGEIGAEYDLLRTVVLKADAGFINIDYQGTARSDNLFSAGFGADWRVSRDFTVSPFYDFNFRKTTQVGLGFRSHELGLDARYRF